MVAKKVRDSLPVILCTQWKASLTGEQSCLNKSENAPESTMSEDAASLSMDDECCESWEIEENEQLPEMYLPLKQSMLKAFKLMDKELKLHPAIDCFCSGTTAVTLVKQVLTMSGLKFKLSHLLDLLIKYSDVLPRIKF